MKRGRCLAGTLVVVALGLGGVAMSRRLDTTPPPPPDYANGSAWLCRPGRSDACGTLIRSTVIMPNGVRRQATFAPDPTAGIDCFYVYPTVSRARVAYAPVAVTPDLDDVARRQLARLATVCRPFAPIYRQVTLAGLRPLFRGDARVTLAVPLADVKAAWHRYLAEDNGGRGIVLIGHSQGSRLLARLMADEIEGTPVQARLVAAIIPGATIDVPAGQGVGGTFKTIPLCDSALRTGCAIAYSSFPADRPMAAKARYGAGSAGLRDACVDPARLAGAARLSAVLPLPPDMAAKVGTPFADFPDALGAKCRWDGRFSVLAVTVGGDAPLGETMVALVDRLAHTSPAAGFHALDIELALGTLVDLVARKAAAMPRSVPPVR